MMTHTSGASPTSPHGTRQAGPRAKPLPWRRRCHRRRMRRRVHPGVAWVPRRAGTPGAAGRPERRAPRRRAAALVRAWCRSASPPRVVPRDGCSPVSPPPSRSTVATGARPATGTGSPRYRTHDRCSTLQGGGAGHPARSGPKGRSGMARTALSDDGAVGPTAGRAGSQARGGRATPALTGRQWPVKQEPKAVPRNGTDRNLLPPGRRGRQCPISLPRVRATRPLAKVREGLGEVVRRGTARSQVGRHFLVRPPSHPASRPQPQRIDSLA
jgi:hypothetical protein